MGALWGIARLFQLSSESDDQGLAMELSLQRHGLAFGKS
jgi:hypothetical protein